MTNTESEWGAARLQAAEVAGSDPVLRQLSRTEIPPILIGTIYTIVFICMRILAAWNAGHLWTVGNVTGYLEDPGLLTNLFGLAIITYYVWMPRGIVAVFNGIYANGVIGEPRLKFFKNKDSKQAYPFFLRNLQVWFGRWWWPVISLVIAIGATLILNLPQYRALGHVSEGQIPAWTADTFSLTLTIIWVAINIYCILLMLFYSILSIFYFNNLFKSFAIRIRFLHPDRAAGFAPLGDFTLTMSYLIVFIGILLVLTPVTRNLVVTGTLQFRWSNEILLALGVYILVAPIIFFEPLRVAHNSMKEAKDQLLLQIAQRFETEYRSTHNKLDGDISGLKDELNVFEELQSLHKITSKFPVWPLNTTNLSRFGTSYVSPVILAFVIDLVSRLANI